MKIKGSITHLLLGSNIDKESLIGQPINNSKGHKIGTITSVDIDNDNWYGEIDNLSVERLISQNISVLLSIDKE